MRIGGSSPSRCWSSAGCCSAPLFAQAARTKSPELFLSASLLVVIVASLATRLSASRRSLGALIAGMLIAETDYRGEVEVIIAPFERPRRSAFS